VRVLLIEIEEDRYLVTGFFKTELSEEELLQYELSREEKQELINILMHSL